MKNLIMIHINNNNNIKTIIQINNIYIAKSDPFYINYKLKLN